MTAPDDTCGQDSKSKEVNVSESGVESDTESHENEPQKKKLYHIHEGVKKGINLVVDKFHLFSFFFFST